MFPAYPLEICPFRSLIVVLSLIGCDPVTCSRRALISRFSYFVSSRNISLCTNHWFIISGASFKTPQWAASVQCLSCVSTQIHHLPMASDLGKCGLGGGTAPLPGRAPGRRQRHAQPLLQPRHAEHPGAPRPHPPRRLPPPPSLLPPSSTSPWQRSRSRSRDPGSLGSPRAPPPPSAYNYSTTTTTTYNPPPLAPRQPPPPPRAAAGGGGPGGYAYSSSTTTTTTRTLGNTVGHLDGGGKGGVRNLCKRRPQNAV